jgi:formate hydrogenlyase transcriptional activator
MTAARKDLGSKDERSHSPAKKSERGGPSALKPRVGSGSEAQPDRSSTDFEGIIGESATLKRALSDARIVASNDATVLILGETGTGKELIARAIHRMSPRKAAGFIKLNCAALPLGLMESELFGYERGAFTDAYSMKIGRLELSDNGTLFLDEIGELPLEIQPKLLRVLQDREFERLGGTSTIRVNLRLIAATNRDLAKEVAEHRFRSDLFYRLNVFPIQMPPLRARSADIPLLVRHFVQKFTRRMNRKIETIPDEVMNAILHYAWPGNVRELENFLERSVILSEGSVLQAPVAELRWDSELGTTAKDAFISMQREHIVKVLRRTRGVISGPRGAARLLGLKRTTLQSIMQRLKIGPKDHLG